MNRPSHRSRMLWLPRLSITGLNQYHSSGNNNMNELFSQAPHFLLCCIIVCSNASTVFSRLWSLVVYTLIVCTYTWICMSWRSLSPLHQTLHLFLATAVPIVPTHTQHYGISPQLFLLTRSPSPTPRLGTTRLLPTLPVCLPPWKTRSHFNKAP